MAILYFAILSFVLGGLVVRRVLASSTIGPFIVALTALLGVVWAASAAATLEALLPSRPGAVALLLRPFGLLALATLGVGVFLLLLVTAA